LCFELLNEPHADLTPERWNELLGQALDVVRRTNPNRRVLIGPAAMNTLDALTQLELPDDERLVVTVHYYAPLSFTHQGAPWWPGADRWVGTTWDPDRDSAAVHADLAALAEWSNDRGVTAFVGEFGTHEVADMTSRAAWTTTVRRELERLRIGWCYWDFDTDFGAYDAEHRSWREPLRAALFMPVTHR
jgi:endoglucanase